MKQVFAYESKNGALEKSMHRAVAWDLYELLKGKIDFTAALKLVEHREEVVEILKQMDEHNETV
jgi:hypothetical protein